MGSPLDQLSEECNRLVFEAVNEDSLPKLKLAQSTYSPTQLLTSFAQCNEKGVTPLTVAVARENISLIKEMVTWMLDYQNHLFHKKECQSMPIFIIDQLSHHIAFLAWDEKYDLSGNFFNYSCDRKSWLKLIDLVFLQSTSLTGQNKIIALELIGALAIIHCCNSKSKRFALKCWREAMTLRYFPQDGEPLLPKVPAMCVPTQASSVIFGSAAEIVTMEELKLLEEDFERNSLSSKCDWRLLFEKRMQIQALLVMRRIFSQANLGHPHWLYLESLLEYADFWDTREKIENLSTYLFIFEQLNGSDPKLLSHRSFIVFLSTISSTLFSLEMYNPHKKRKKQEAQEDKEEEPGFNNPAREKLFFHSLLALTKFIVTVSEFFPDPAMISSVQFQGSDFEEIVYCLLCLLVDISSQISDQEKHQLEENVSYYIRNFFPERTTTVLHWAANEAHRTDGWFYQDRVAEELRKPLQLKKIHTRIKLILQLGADVNAINDDGRTPLHLLAPMQENPCKEYANIFQTLVDAGSNLYLADYYGETVISILREFVDQNQNSDEIRGHHYFESLINDVFPLTCLCARVIRRHRIPFLKDQLPLTLHKLVSP